MAASRDEQAEIVRFFVMHAPNGQVLDVIKDLRTLLDDPSVLSDSVVEDVLIKYNMEQLFFAEAKDKKQVIVSEQGRVDDSHFYDPDLRKVLEFDHTRRVFSGSERSENKSSSVDAYRDAVQASVDKYASECFTEGKHATAVYASGKTLTIVISGKNLNLSNYWSGGWRSVYTLDLSGGAGSAAALEGSIRLNVHYFEDGNVQLNSDYKSTTNISIDDPESVATAVSKALVKVESDFQQNLEQFYSKMHNETFKAMRRFLPYHRQKMKWNIDVHSLAESVGGAQ